MTQLSTRRRVYAEAHMFIHDNERYFDDYMVHETHKPPRRLPGPGTAELRKLWLLRPKSTMILARGGVAAALDQRPLRRQDDVLEQNKDKAAIPGSLSTTLPKV
ncbi:hypothetical protein MCOR31_008232 [Pyricularia oryzae]|nr:hypothetical protein MCOR26_007683 [Pyricularia oryzae]KAI6362410.1 hypothetical protein MCOR31_008232 [Pyricularia oryzae]KAI6489670.1 hypothetical protein MCOR11_007819 [Pyricularia oryzae]KAI6541103.1 hypothetical protein MCOR05_004042 [Pyricularia oryzae]